MYSTLKPTIRFTRNTRCPCSNDCDDHGDFFSRHKAGPPDEPSVDGRWCNVQHQEHMTVQSSCTQNNMWIRHQTTGFWGPACTPKDSSTRKRRNTAIRVVSRCLFKQESDPTKNRQRMCKNFANKMTDGSLSCEEVHHVERQLRDPVPILAIIAILAFVAVVVFLVALPILGAATN